MRADGFAGARTSTATPAADLLVALAGLGGLAAAVALRVRLAGAEGARSPLAGLWFAAVLAVVAYVTLDRHLTRGTTWARTLLVGTGGAVVLCVPAAVRHAWTPTPAPAGGYVSWALVVTVVAVAEEALLRGSLFGRLARSSGPVTAVAVTSLAFALLHAPIYGWDVVPLDCAVGVCLGVMRLMAGTAAAPALAHVLADLAGWWVR